MTGDVFVGWLCLLVGAIVFADLLSRML